jgi:hypothetical protein
MDDLATRVKNFLKTVERGGGADFFEPVDESMRKFAVKNFLDCAYDSYKQPDGLTAVEISNFVRGVHALSVFGNPESPVHDVFPEESQQAQKLTAIFQTASALDERKFDTFHLLSFYELWDAYREKNPQLEAVRIDDSDVKKIKSVLLAVTESHAADEIARRYGGECLENASAEDHAKAKAAVEEMVGELPWTPTYEMLKKMKTELDENATFAAQNSPPVRVPVRPKGKKRGL